MQMGSMQLNSTSVNVVLYLSFVDIFSKETLLAGWRQYYANNNVPVRTRERLESMVTEAAHALQRCGYEDQMSLRRVIDYRVTNSSDMEGALASEYYHGGRGARLLSVLCRIEEITSDFDHDTGLALQGLLRQLAAYLRRLGQLELQKLHRLLRPKSGESTPGIITSEAWRFTMSYN